MPKQERAQIVSAIVSVYPLCLIKGKNADTRKNFSPYY